MIWWVASSAVTACTRLPSPTTSSADPCRRTSRTSCSAVSSASSSGPDGRNRSVCSVATRATSPAGVSSATTAPASITARRSQSRSASAMKWVTSSTVTPRSRMPSIRSQVSRRACGSRPVVSSSRIARRGLPISASAIDTRCFWPPDSERHVAHGDRLAVTLLQVGHGDVGHEPSVVADRPRRINRRAIARVNQLVDPRPTPSPTAAGRARSGRRRRPARRPASRSTPAGRDRAPRWRTRTGVPCR